MPDLQEEEVASMEEAGASCNGHTKQGRPQNKQCPTPSGFFHEQVAIMLRRKQCAELKKIVKGKVVEPVSTDSSEQGTDPPNVVKEKQGTHLVTENEKIPCLRPVLNNENYSGVVTMTGSKPCHGPGSQGKEEQGVKVKHCSPVLEDPIETTIDEFGFHGNSSRKVCFPNSQIRHIYHPGLSRDCINVVSGIHFSI